jgi:hypothetical protein
MAKKMIPFIKNPAQPAAAKKDIVEEGKLDDLYYTIFKRGNIHIYDDKNNLFKKDCDAFEDEMKNLGLSAMKEGETLIIQGCGDTDNLIFTQVDGDIKITVEKKDFEIIKKLKGLIKKAKGAK